MKEYENRKADIVFEPRFTGDKLQDFVVIKSDIRYVYGHIKGWVSDEDNNKIEFENVKAFIELLDVRW